MLNEKLSEYNNIELNLLMSDLEVIINNINRDHRDYCYITRRATIFLKDLLEDYNNEKICDVKSTKINYIKIDRLTDQDFERIKYNYQFLKF